MDLSSSKEGSSSCQCTTTSHGENEETLKKCEMNPVTVANYARRFLLGRWSFFGTWIRREMVRNFFSDKWNGEWDKTPEVMMLHLHSVK